MPTIMAHAAVPLACALALGQQHIAPRLAIAGMALAMLPDADVIGFGLGIDYADDWGHRGATHALAMAVIVGAAIAAIWKPARSVTGFAFLTLAMASHGLMDMLTNGGLGVALFWPFETGRHFWPVTPIRVSPIGADFVSARGLETLFSELIWIGLPCVLLALVGQFSRKRLAT